MSFYRFALLAMVVAPAAEACNIEIVAPWIRLAPPGAEVLAGYGGLHNTEAAANSVIGARADGFERVELHQTVQVGEQMQMREVEALAVEGGATVWLEPGGLHLMLISPSRAYAEGDQVKVTLTVESGCEFEASFAVLRDPPADFKGKVGAEADHSHHHH